MNLRWKRTHLMPPIEPQTQSGPDPRGLTSHWLPVQEMKRTLRAAALHWQRAGLQANAALSALAEVQYQVWAAASYPAWPVQIGCVRDMQGVHGFVCGYPRHGHRCFFISALAISPWVADAHPVAQQLVELAMDESQAMGCNGWVACEPHQADETIWHRLGFSRYDDFTWRRMGYFV